MGNLKGLIKTSIEKNPDENDKFIKESFEKGLKKKLLSKIIQSDKHIMIIRKVEVMRLQKKLRYVVEAEPV